MGIFQVTTFHGEFISWVHGHINIGIGTSKDLVIFMDIFSD